MTDHNRPWLRLAATILAAEGILTFVYAGFLPSPILTDIGVSVPILGRLTIFWGVVGSAYLAAAVGVASRRRWGRALAVVMAGVGLTSSSVGLIAALTGADLMSVFEWPRRDRTGRNRAVRGAAAVAHGRRPRRIERLELARMTTTKRIILAVIVVGVVVAATALGYADTDRVLRRLGLVR